MAKAENKTQATDADVMAFLEEVENPVRRADAMRLHEIFTEETGWAAQMWGPTIVGYGSYHYWYNSGREGDMCATGFSPRKANLSLYIMPGYQDLSEYLDRLGKHKNGKACLYINKLADVDEDVIREIIRAGLEKLESHWPVKPS